MQNLTQVILVNHKDEWIGTMEKMQAHKEGYLHRALSVIIMNDNNEMLIQQRAEGKYHSGSLWSNACCSHPMPGESTIGAAHRRLKEELGFDCDLDALFTMQYKTEVDNSLTEHEYDHIFIGNYNGPVNINPEEVKDYKYISLTELGTWMKKAPGAFTSWFKLAFPKIISHIKEDSTVT